MERLTEQGFDFTSDFVASNLQSWPIAQALNRLSAYEDSGLAPEQISRFCWIPMGERPPKENGRYYCYDQSHDWKFIAAFHGGGKWAVDSNMAGSVLLTVTHWMPLYDSPDENNNMAHVRIDLPAVITELGNHAGVVAKAAEIERLKAELSDVFVRLSATETAARILRLALKRACRRIGIRKLRPRYFIMQAMREIAHAK